MKNINNPGQFKSSSSFAISVTIDEVPLLTNMVQKLAYRRHDTGYNLEATPDGWVAIDTSSIEAYVSGSMDILSHEEQISLSYATCFSFTCVKPAGGENRLCWVNSLS